MRGTVAKRLHKHALTISRKPPFSSGKFTIRQIYRKIKKLYIAGIFIG